MNTSTLHQFSKVVCQKLLTDSLMSNVIAYNKSIVVRSPFPLTYLFEKYYLIGKTSKYCFFLDLKRIFGAVNLAPSFNIRPKSTLIEQKGFLTRELNFRKTGTTFTRVVNRKNELLLNL